MEKSIQRRMLEFCIPIIFMYIINQAYSFVDNVIVATYVNERALAILSSCMSVINVGFSLTSGIGSAASLLVSRHVGAKEYDKLPRILRDAVMVGLMLSALIVTFFFLFTRPLLSVIHTPAEIVNETTILVYIYTLSIVMGILCVVLHSSLSGMGESKRPTFYITLTQVLNIVLDVVVVKYLHWGVNGAALASLFSQFVSILFLIPLLKRKLGEYNVTFQTRTTESFTGKVLRLGVPCLLQQSVMSVGALFINSYVNTFGVSYISGFSAVNTIGNLMLVPMLGITTTLEIFSSMSIGAKNKDQLHTVKRTLFPIGLIFCGIVIVASLALRQTFVGLFLENPNGESFSFATTYLIFYSFSYVFIFIKYFFDSLFKAYQKVSFFVVTSFVALGSRILLTYLLAPALQVNSVIAATLLGNLIAMLVAIVLYATQIKKFNQASNL